MGSVWWRHGYVVALGCVRADFALSEFEQVRHVASLTKPPDPLAEFVASARRMDIHLLARDDGPDRGVQCLLRQVGGEVGDGGARHLRQSSPVDRCVPGSPEPLDPAVDALPLEVERRTEQGFVGNAGSVPVVSIFSLRQLVANYPRRQRNSMSDR